MSRLYFIIITIIIILFTASTKTVAQNSLYYQGFEGNLCENWNYSGGVVATGVQRTGTHSGRTGYISNSLLFSPADVSGYSGLVLTIFHSVKPGPGPGMDTREGAVVQVSIDGGPFVTLGSVGGYNDANWTFNSSTGGAVTGSSGCTIYQCPNPVVYNIPTGATTVQVKVVSIKTSSCGAFNNSMLNATPNLYDRSDEGFYIDDVQITTTSPLSPVTLTSGPGTDAQHVSSCIPMSISDIEYSAGFGVVDVTGLPPGVTYNYAGGIVTISGSPSVDGVYNYTVKNICTDSSATGSITKITPEPVTQTADSIGCNAVVYNGTTYTSSTVLNETIKSFQGCDSIYKVTNIVITPVVPVTQTTNLSGCNNVVFNGTNYTSSIVLNDTLKSYQGCDSVFIVTNIVVTPIVAVTQTTNLSGCNSVVFNGISFTSSIILNDTLRSHQGCDSIYKITNIIVTLVVPVIQTTNLAGCNNVVFNGTTYTSSAVLNDTLKSYQGCDSVFIVTNIIVTPIVAVTQTTNLRGCNSVIFNGTTYTSSVVLNDTLRSYQGCDSVHKITNIIVTPIMAVTQTTNLSGCNSIVFNGTTYTSSIVLNDTLKSYQKCDSVYKITYIVVTPIIAVTQTTNLSGCNSVVFTGTTYTSSIVLNDTLRSYQGCDSVYKITNIVVNRITPVPQETNLSGCNSFVFNGTTYTSSFEISDTIKSSGGCDSIYRKVHIIIIPNDFVLNLTSSANNINPGMPVILTTSSASDYTIISWQPTTVFSSQTESAQNIFSDTSMNILVTAKSNEGCIGYAMLLLTVNQLQDDIYFPSAFSPNSNAGNRTFGPLGRLSLMSNYSLVVYNRWGELVFSSSDPYQKWDGTQKNFSLNSGNFVWQANYLYKGVQKRIKKGNVVLIK